MDIQTITRLFRRAYHARLAWRRVADKYRAYPSIAYVQELRTARAVYGAIQDMIGTMDLGPLWEEVLLVCEYEPDEDDIVTAIRRVGGETKGGFRR